MSLSFAANLIILQKTYEVDEPSWVVDKEQLWMIGNTCCRSHTNSFLLSVYIFNAITMLNRLYIGHG